jgi:hypothetical protein
LTYYSKITAIQLQKRANYIQFTIPGGRESTGGLLAAMKDENTIVFSSCHRDLIQALRDFIESKIEGEDSSDALRRLQREAAQHAELPFNGCMVPVILFGGLAVLFILYMLFVPK